MVKDTKLYDILKVDPKVSESDLKKAYKKLVLIHHPDKNGGDDTVFKKLNDAYSILSNNTTRQLYDNTGQTSVKEPPTTTDIFSTGIFNFHNFFTQQPVSTKDTSMHLQVTLEDIYNGNTKNIHFSRQIMCTDCDGIGGKKQVNCKDCNGRGLIYIQQQLGVLSIQTQCTCTTCNGRGKQITEKCIICKGEGCIVKMFQTDLEIPQGVTDGHIIILKGMANEEKGKVTGNLCVVIKETKNDTFKRSKNDIHVNVQVPLTTALIGGTLTISHLDKESIQIDIPKGKIIRPNDHLVLEKKGMPIYGKNGEYGDFIIKFSIVFPPDNWVKTVDENFLKKVLDQK